MSRPASTARTARAAGIACVAIALACMTALAASAAPRTGSPIPVTGLVRVEVTTYQSLPPPYKPGHAVLTSPSALAAFAKAVRDDRIALRQSTSISHDCTGGIEYTVVVTTKKARTTLRAYRCGGTITGNLSGNVAAFLRDLGSI